MSQMLTRLIEALHLKSDKSDGNKSSVVAKDRLKLIILHDHLDISPQLMEQMKKELIEVVSKHVNLDSKGIKVEIGKEGSLAVLVANFPMLKPKKK